MYIQQAAQIPMVIYFGGFKLEVPLFRTADWLKWTAEIDTQRVDMATKGMTPEVRFRMLTFYNFMPTTIDEARDWVRTPAGVQRVVRVCLQRAKIIGKLEPGRPPEETVELNPALPITKEIILQILTTSRDQHLETLALELAQMIDHSKPTPKQLKEIEEKNKKEEGTFEEEDEASKIDLNGGTEDPLLEIETLG